MVAGSVLIIRMIFFNYLAALSLSCSMWDLVPWPGIKPEPPALGAGSLSPRTAREVPWWRFSEMIICPLLGWQDFINPLQFGSHYLALSGLSVLRYHNLHMYISPGIFIPAICSVWLTSVSPWPYQLLHVGTKSHFIVSPAASTELDT